MLWYIFNHNVLHDQDNICWIKSQCMVNFVINFETGKHFLINSKWTDGNCVLTPQHCFVESEIWSGTAEVRFYIKTSTKQFVGLRFQDRCHVLLDIHECTKSELFWSRRIIGWRLRNSTKVVGCQADANKFTPSNSSWPKKAAGWQTQTQGFATEISCCLNKTDECLFNK